MRIPVTAARTVRPLESGGLVDAATTVQAGVHAARRADYIYIASRGHSGSTLLELLLDRHPALVALGELEKLSLQFARGDRGRCSCGQRPTTCPVWAAVADAVRGQYAIDLRENPFAFRVSPVGLEEDRGKWALAHWLLHRHYRLWRYAGYAGVPLARHASFLSLFHRRWARNRFFVANAVRQATGAQATVDSSKDYLGMLDLYTAACRTVKILFMTRDVRGNTWSYIKGQGKSAVEAARAWTDYNRRTHRLLERLPQDAWMHVKYEELCHDLAGTLRRICDFLGYAYSDTICDPKEQPPHTIGGNKIRHSALHEVQEDLSWKENLSQRQLRQIADVARPTAERLGYALR